MENIIHADKKKVKENIFQRKDFLLPGIIIVVLLGLAGVLALGGIDFESLTGGDFSGVLAEGEDGVTRAALKNTSKVVKTCKDVTESFADPLKKGSTRYVKTSGGQTITITDVCVSKSLREYSCRTYAGKIYLDTNYYIDNKPNNKAGCECASGKCTVNR